MLPQREGKGRASFKSALIIQSPEELEIGSPFCLHLRFCFWLIEYAKSTRTHLVLRREICASIDRFECGSEKNRHGPSSASSSGLHKTHIDFVHVWPFLAIHFDIDEVLVHNLGHLKKWCVHYYYLDRRKKVMIALSIGQHSSSSREEAPKMPAFDRWTWVPYNGFCLQPGKKHPKRSYIFEAPHHVQVILLLQLQQT